MILFEHLFALSSVLCVAYGDGNNPMSSPAAGEVIEAEEPYLISWSNGTPGPVSIDLRFADTTAVLITSETLNNGSYTWIPSGVLAGKDNYFMAICDAGVNDCTYTFNGRFAIEGAGALSSSSSSTITSTTLFTSSSTSSAVTSSTSVLTSSETSPSATASPSPPQNTNSGLPIGAKIAIGSVCGVVGITLILLGTFCLLRKRKRSKAASEPQFVHTEAGKVPALKTDGGASGGHMAQMSELHDVPVERPRAELS